MMAFEQAFEGAGVKAYDSRWAHDREALKAFDASNSNLAGREEQGPRLPQRAKPSPDGAITASAGAGTFEHGNLHDTIALLDQVQNRVDRIDHAQVHVMSGPRHNG